MASDEEVNREFRELMSEAKRGKIRSPEEVQRDKEKFQEGYERFKKRQNTLARFQVIQSHSRKISKGADKGAKGFIKLIDQNRAYTRSLSPRDSKASKLKRLRSIISTLKQRQAVNSYAQAVARQQAMQAYRQQLIQRFAGEGLDYSDMQVAAIGDFEAHMVDRFITFPTARTVANREAWIPHNAALQLEREAFGHAQRQHITPSFNVNGEAFFHATTQHKKPVRNIHDEVAFFANLVP